MNDRARVILTAILGVAMAVAFWVNWQEPRPSLGQATGYRIGVTAILLVVPLLVSRWWVVLALAGPLAFLGYWQLMGHHVYADGEAPPLNAETIFGMFWLALLLLLLVGVRRVWDGARRRWGNG